MTDINQMSDDALLDFQHKLQIAAGLDDETVTIEQYLANLKRIQGVFCD